MSVNKAIIVGNLGADPELRYTATGKAVCNLSVATNRRYTNDAGETQDETTWHRVSVWGRQAESCRDHLKRGRQVYVEGAIKNNSYVDKDGVKKHSTEIVAFNVRFLGGRSADAEDGAHEPRAAANGERPPRPEAAQPPSAAEDVPF